MPTGLHLHVKEFRDETRWRWELRDEHGALVRLAARPVLK